MVRTQIQLTGEQAEGIRSLAAERGVSMATLIREAVDLLLAEHTPVSRTERASRVMAVAGRHASGRSDVSERHDEYFADAAHER